MQLTCIQLRNYLGKVKIFRAATGKYLDYKQFLCTENQLLFKFGKRITV